MTNQQVYIAIVAAGRLLGTVFALEFTVPEFTGTGYIEVELVSREVGNPDDISHSRANIQSLARVYPAGVSLVTVGRPRLNYQSGQNRDSQATWTAGQKPAAAAFLQTYGEKVDAGTRYESMTGPLYSCVPTGTAIAHVKVG